MSASRRSFRALALISILFACSFLLMVQASTEPPAAEESDVPEAPAEEPISNEEDSELEGESTEASTSVIHPAYTTLQSIMHNKRVQGVAIGIVLFMLAMLLFRRRSRPEEDRWSSTSTGAPSDLDDQFIDRKRARTPEEEERAALIRGAWQRAASRARELAQAEKQAEKEAPADKDVFFVDQKSGKISLSVKWDFRYAPEIAVLLEKLGAQDAALYANALDLERKVKVKSYWNSHLGKVQTAQEAFNAVIDINKGVLKLSPQELKELLDRLMLVHRTDYKEAVAQVSAADGSH